MSTNQRLVLFYVNQSEISVVLCQPIREYLPVYWYLIIRMTILDLLCYHHLFWSNLQMELLNRFDWLIRLPLPFSGETFVQSLKILAAWFCWVKHLIYIQIIRRCSLLSLSNWREQETEILDFQVVPVTGHFCNKLLSFLMQISSFKSCHFCSKKR